MSSKSEASDASMAPLPQMAAHHVGGQAPAQFIAGKNQSQPMSQPDARLSLYPDQVVFYFRNNGGRDRKQNWYWATPKIAVTTNESFHHVKSTDLLGNASRNTQRIQARCRLENANWQLDDRLVIWEWGKKQSDVPGEVHASDAKFHVPLRELLKSSSYPEYQSQQCGAFRNDFVFGLTDIIYAVDRSHRFKSNYVYMLAVIRNIGRPDETIVCKPSKVFCILAEPKDEPANQRKLKNTLFLQQTKMIERPVIQKSARRPPNATPNANSWYMGVSQQMPTHVHISDSTMTIPHDLPGVPTGAGTRKFPSLANSKDTSGEERRPPGMVEMDQKRGLVDMDNRMPAQNGQLNQPMLPHLPNIGNLNDMNNFPLRPPLSNVGTYGPTPMSPAVHVPLPGAPYSPPQVVHSIKDQPSPYVTPHNSDEARTLEAGRKFNETERMDFRMGRTNGNNRFSHSNSTHQSLSTDDGSQDRSKKYGYNSAYEAPRSNSSMSHAQQFLPGESHGGNMSGHDMVTGNPSATQSPMSHSPVNPMRTASSSPYLRNRTPRSLGQSSSDETVSLPGMPPILTRPLEAGSSGPEDSRTVSARGSPFNTFGPPTQNGHPLVLLDAQQAMAAVPNMMVGHPNVPSRPPIQASTNSKSKKRKLNDPTDYQTNDREPLPGTDDNRRTNPAQPRQITNPIAYSKPVEFHSTVIACSDVCVSGNLICRGMVGRPSQRKYKQNINEMPEDMGLNTIRKFKVRQYEYLDDPKNTQHFGVVIDELPEQAKEALLMNGGNAVRENQFQWMTIKALQQLDQKQTHMKETQEGMQKRIESLERKLDRMAIDNRNYSDGEENSITMSSQDYSGQDNYSFLPDNGYNGNHQMSTLSEVRDSSCVEEARKMITRMFRSLRDANVDGRRTAGELLDKLQEAFEESVRMMVSAKMGSYRPEMYERGCYRRNLFNKGARRQLMKKWKIAADARVPSKIRALWADLTQGFVAMACQIGMDFFDEEAILGLDINRNEMDRLLRKAAEGTCMLRLCSSRDRTMVLGLNKPKRRQLLLSGALETTSQQPVELQYWTTDDGQSQRKFKRIKCVCNNLVDNPCRKWGHVKDGEVVGKRVSSSMNF